MPALTHAGAPPRVSVAARLFPPSLVPVLRDRVDGRAGCLSDVGNEVVAELLTTVFFAGLETHEGERNPVRVVFVGKKTPAILPEDQVPGAAPVYRWKILRFAAPRPFAVRELVKLAVATIDERIYAVSQVTRDGGLAITGLAREGINAGGDAFVKIVVPRPGGLSIRSGREHLLEYEHGSIIAGGEDVVFGAGQVRVALESTARAAGLDEHSLPDYVDTVRSLVQEMATHGRGGILVINVDESPRLPENTAYRMIPDSALAPLLRISRLLALQETIWHAHATGHGSERPNTHVGGAETHAFRHLLRNSFLTEAERIVQELGALTGIDGATVLNRSLGLVAFGVILPVSQETRVTEAGEFENGNVRAVDLGSRGTRHRAGATYAAEHPGSVVFVASEDGQVTCLFRSAPLAPVLMWRLGASDVHVP